MSRDFLKEAREAAADLVDEFMDDIVDDLFISGEAKTDDTDYSDYVLHERYIDRSFDNQDALDALEQLDEYEEGDSGLWEGMTGMLDMMCACAAWTFGAAIRHMFRTLIEEINEDDEIASIREHECEDEDAEGVSKAKIRARVEHISKRFSRS